MDAKKCDRCGKFYDVPTKTVIVRCRGTIFDKVYDLCEECQEDLRQFMNIQEENNG